MGIVLSYALHLLVQETRQNPTRKTQDESDVFYSASKLSKKITKTFKKEIVNNIHIVPRVDRLDDDMN